MKEVRRKALTIVAIIVVTIILSHSRSGGPESVFAQERANTCPASTGFWKSHPHLWPISQTLGTQIYARGELLSLLKAPSQGDASIILAHQLIATLHNVANGADPIPIGRTVSTAQSMLADYRGKLPYEVAPSSARGQEMLAVKELLENYNKGQMTPDCVPGQMKEVGTVSGVVTEAASGRPIEGAAVLASVDGALHRFVTTDANGLYAMLGLAPGVYVLEVFAPPFQPSRPEEIPVAAGRHALVEFRLQPDSPPGGAPPTAVACWIDGLGAVVCADPNGASAFPLTTVQLTGVGSSDPDGDRLTFEWRLARTPEGSSTSINDGSSPTPTLFVDLVGDYMVCLTVTDATGLQSSEACVTVHVSADNGFIIQLTWDRARTDLDLHFLHPNGSWGETPWDCYWFNRKPNWGDPASTADDPFLDLDNVDGFGPENIRIAEPEEGVAYAVGAHYWADNGGGPTTPTIRVYANGILVYEKAGSVLPEGGYFWEAAEITWSSGIATVTEIDRITPTIP